MSFISITPNQSQIYTALRAFLLAVVPDGVEVITGQTNRTPEPKSSTFIMMNITRTERLRTNVDTYADCKFTGSIVGNILNVNAFAPNSKPLTLGQPVWGTCGVLPNTIVTGTTQSVGGTGPFQVSNTQTVNGSMSAGGTTFEIGSEFIIQCDVHAPDDSSSDVAQTIQTMFRDQFAVDLFRSFPWDIWPIHCDDPRQVPFINASDQYETRFIVEIHLQANQIVSGVGQQFFDVAKINLIEVL